jgi:formate hydrogenlyase subunit 3/multisubunit Na+/H+ antiporter MnhD subunit
MRGIFSRFFKSDAGAVTVDWVVLTAALTTMAIGVISVVQQGAVDEAAGIGAFVQAVNVGD